MRRFANFSCPVCTHYVSFLFNDLGCAHLRPEASFAGYSAPRVHHKLTPFCSVSERYSHEIHLVARIPQSSNRLFYNTAPKSESLEEPFLRMTLLVSFRVACADRKGTRIESNEEQSVMKAADVPRSPQ
jgi:hypothetical protein